MTPGLLEQVARTEGLPPDERAELSHLDVARELLAGHTSTRERELEDAFEALRRLTPEDRRMVARCVRTGDQEPIARAVVSFEQELGGQLLPAARERDAQGDEPPLREGARQHAAWLRRRPRRKFKKVLDRATCLGYTSPCQHNTPTGAQTMTKTTTANRKTPGYASSLIVLVDGVEVGFVARKRSTRTVVCPWQVWLLDGPEVDGSGHGSTGTYLGAWYAAGPWIEADAETQTNVASSWPAARRAAIAAASLSATVAA